jgi:hypothetical protein
MGFKFENFFPQKFQFWALMNSLTKQNWIIYYSQKVIICYISLLKTSSHIVFIQKLIDIVQERKIDLLTFNIYSTDKYTQAWNINEILERLLFIKEFQNIFKKFTKIDQSFSNLFQTFQFYKKYHYILIFDKNLNKANRYIYQHFLQKISSWSC